MVTARRQVGKIARGEVLKNLSTLQHLSTYNSKRTTQSIIEKSHFEDKNFRWGGFYHVNK